MKKGKPLIIIALSITLIFLSIFPTLKLYISTPADSVYTFIHNSVSDYPYYISFIRQGYYRNTTIDQFTSESQKDGLIHIFYLYLGKMGKITGFDPLVTYFLSRIILGILFLLTGYKLLSHFLSKPRHRIMAYIFFIASASFPKVINISKGLDVWPFMYWWTEIDPYQRAVFIPHFLMGHIGLAGIILLLILLFRLRKPEYLILSVILGFITGFAHPPSLGMVYYIFSAYLLIRFLTGFFVKIKTISFKRYFGLFIFFFVFVIFTVPSLIYILKTTTAIFPWTLMKAQESLFYSISLREFLLSIGPVLPLGLFGILVYFLDFEIRREYPEMLLLVLWVVIDILMVPASWYISVTPVINKIPTFANIRFLSMSVQLPLSILGVIFLDRLSRTSKHLAGLLTGVFLILTLLMHYSYWNSVLVGGNYLLRNEYIKKTVVSAYDYLDKNAKENDTVLADRDRTSLLPLFARNKVYYGQSVYTLNNEWKTIQASNFFSGKMKECEADNFLKSGRIGYILTIGESEREVVGKYRFTENIYGVNSQVQIFRYRADIQKGC